MPDYTTMLIEWDNLDVRVSGERISEIARQMATASSREMESLSLRFTPGLVRIQGAVRKVISVPFSAEVRRIDVLGTSVSVTLSNAAAFGLIPIPAILFRLLESRLPRDLVRLESGFTLVFALDRFLPSFVSVTIEQIVIVEGGLRVRLGPGGADPPPGFGGDHGAAEK